VDRPTFERLVLEHLPAAHRFAVRLTGRVDLAEDVVQDALLRAARAWPALRSEGGFRTWLFRVVVSAWRDGHDHAARRPAGPLVTDPPGPEQDDPATAVVIAELGERVAAAVSALPPRQREVLVLCAYEQMSDVEAAAVLGTNRQNVRTHLHLARRRVAELLRPYLTPGGAEADDARR
jgi:RNA polymerase sigma factor (sigma-70 family)